jgi:hypothetical protein
MIKTRISVNDTEYNFQHYHSSHNNNEFAKVSSRWQQQEWVKYLYEHGEIVKIENYYENFELRTIHEMVWQLSEKYEVFARLKWPEELDKIFK